MNIKMSTAEHLEFEAIVERLEAKESDERRGAVYELVNYEAADIVEILAKIIQDRNRAVREAASEILMTLPAGLCTNWLTPLLGSQRIEVRNIVAAILVKYGESAVQDLIPALFDENEDVRKFSADILGLARNSEAVTDLCKSAINDGVATVVESAIEALGKIGDSRALPTLYQLYAEHNGYDLVTIEAIGLIGDPQSVEFLTNNLTDTDPMVVYAIIDALGNTGSSEALEPMNKYLLDAPDLLKRQTLMTLLKIGQSSDTLILNENTDNLINLIVEELKDPESKITPLVSHQLSLSPQDDILHRLFEYSNDLPSSILVSLLKTCENRAEFINDISRLVDHPDDWVGYSSIEALSHYEKDSVRDTLINVLQQSEGIRLLAAMNVAADLKLSEATIHLESLCENDDEDIRSNASRILQSLRDD